MQILYPEM